MVESLASITLRSLYISSIASLIAFGLAIAMSFIVSQSTRRVSELVLSLFEALVGVPTTVVGLVVYMLLFPGGPLGPLRLLYTPTAIIIGESLVAVPVAFTNMFRHFQSMRESIRELVLSLGIPEKHLPRLLLRELAPLLVSSYLVSFSRAIGELGVALIAGGGIEGYTNVLTTAIAIQTSIGNYEYAIWIGLVLITITIIITVVVKIVGEYLVWK
ncbi:ABC transporter permease [Thermogladius sp. 4427co]|uniref:ABC transporter permease n=1 Tax=Thermogladius sp. 4427co TaxID=3450718 RepID=UPI003F7A4A57